MALVSAEMGEAVGMSHLYPIVPILNFLSMVLILLIVPSFWKTRIVALVSVVGWIFMGNLASFLGMVHWRGHTDDNLVWASILALLGSAGNCGFFASMACFAHFTWQRLQPLSARQLYDTRRRDNLIHFFLTLILPVLWAPLYILSCDHRYQIVEDYGPMTTTRRDWPGFVVLLPVFLGHAAVGIFSVLALVRYWLAKQEDAESDPLKHHPSVRTRKLHLMAVVNILISVYGTYGQFNFWRNVGNGWVPPKSLAENIASLQLVFKVTRTDLDATFELNVGRTVNTIFMPLRAFYMFAWFGCGAEARKAYGDGLLKFGRTIGVAGTLFFSWSAIALRKAKPYQGLVDPLALIPPNALQFAPYIAPLPQEHGPQLPADPMMHPSNPVGNVIDSKRRAPSKDPVRRLSTHKPPFVPLDSTNPAVHTLASVPNPPAHRLSYHKPALTPLDPENSILDARLQEESAPRSQARRLSYHKPPFRPFVPANVNARSATPDALGTSIPLVDVQRRPESSGTTGLPAAGTVDALPPPSPTSSIFMAPPPSPSRPLTYVAPPSLSSPSTSTASSSRSSERTATPAPPYQDTNAFFGRTT